MTAQPKIMPVRDQIWMDHLKTQRCVLTGRLGSVTDVVDPAHIGTLGRAIKQGDDNCLPILHSLHAEMHQKGEITTLRKLASDGLLRAAFQALAQRDYRIWKGVWR